MKLLVTGGAGFIGSNFIKYWLNNHKNDSILNLDKLTYAGNLNNLRDVEKNPRYEFVKGDIIDYKLVDKLVKKVDIIVHFAAESHVDRSINNSFDFIDTNVRGTGVLLECALKNNKKRFHHISTDEVFGELLLKNKDIRFTEKTPYNPSSPYSAAKAASDFLVRAYNRTHGLPITISNCSNNYGPFMFPEKLIPLVITRALDNEKIPVYRKGDQVRDWIYVEDHCRGIELCIEEGNIGETYLLGGNGEKENIWIVKKILEILNKSEELIVHTGDRKGHDVRYAVDFSKANKELGYKPKKKIEAYLLKTVRWYKENEFIWRPLKKQADVIANKYLLNKT